MVFAKIFILVTDLSIGASCTPLLLQWCDSMNQHLLNHIMKEKSIDFKVVTHLDGNLETLQITPSAETTFC